MGWSVKRKIEKRVGGERGEACFSGRQLVKRKSRFSLKRLFSLFRKREFFFFASLRKRAEGRKEKKIEIGNRREIS